MATNEHIVAAQSVRRSPHATPDQDGAKAVIKAPLFPGLPYFTWTRTPRGRYLGRVTFDVEPMTWEEGYKHGLRVAAAAVTWASCAPPAPNPAAVLGDMVEGAVIALNDRRRAGAARAFLDVMCEFMRAGAQWSDSLAYIERKKQDIEQCFAATKALRAEAARASKQPSRRKTHPRREAGQ